MNRRIARNLYSVPRRFDLATLFVISVAYAILFGAMRTLGFPPLAFAAVAGFFSFVGLAQALLFGGRSPRAASVVSGALYYAALMLCVRLRSGISVAYVDIVLTELLCGMFSGSILGYAAGTLIGAIFLAVDYARRFLRALKTRVED